MSVAIRILVSASLLGFLLWQVDWPGVRHGLATAEIGWLVVAFVAFNAAMVLAAKRWEAIVGAAASVSATRLTSLAAVVATYVSLWLSNFLPTAFGGDIARVVAAQRAGNRVAAAISGALLDRYLGLTMLALLFVTSEALGAALGRPRPLLPIAALLAGGLAIPLLLAWQGAGLRLRRRWLRPRAVRFIARGSSVMRTLRARPATCGIVVVASIAATLLGVAAYWCAIRAIGVAAPFSTALAVAALGTFASAIPVSVSGWGMREGTVALVLVQSGTLSAADASAAALCNGAVIGLTSLVGLVVLLTYAGRRVEGSRRRVTQA
jgi:uncharacterized membrane protein YbhN (UPF0104 family)